MSTFKSTIITQRDATPKVLVDGSLAGGMVTVWQGGLNLPAAGAGPFLKLVSIPSNGRISAIRWQEGGLSGSSKLDVAVFYPTAIPVGGGSFLASGSSGVILASSIFATNLSPSDTGTQLTD